MNATEDGNPLGEAPEVGSIATAVRALNASAETIRRQARVLNEILELHQHMRYEDDYTSWDYCEHCGTVWPCETGRIVERVEL